MEELSEKLLGAAAFTCVPEAEGSQEQKTKERKVAKTLSQLVSQIAAQRKKIEASPREKEIAAVELHTQLHKAAPDFKEMTPALETLMVELPEKHFDHTVWIKCLATFQMTYQDYAGYIGLFRVGVMEASFVSGSWHDMSVL